MRLAQRRKAVGFSQEQLAERLGVERSTIVRWESGDTGPQPWMRPRLARALQVSVERLDQLLSGIADDADESDVARLAHVLRHPGAVDSLAVAQLQGRVHELDAQYDRVPSASLLATTGQHLGQLSHLRSYEATDRVRRELLSVEAEAARLMGQLVWDASQRRDHATAGAYFDQAIAAARELRDATAEAHATLRKSFVALYGEKDPRKGLRLASQAANAADGVSRVLTGMSLLHVAEAHAMMLSRSECQQALGQAEVHFECVTPDDSATVLFSPTTFGRLAGSCYLSLDDPARAQLILEETARAFRPGSKSHAIVLSNLALALIRQRKLDESVEALHRAIDVVEQTWGGGGLNLVFAAGRELRPWRQTAVVQDVHERLLILMARS
jgi:transcriptional regulator with XRE-family HTH domain